MRAHEHDHDHDETAGPERTKNPLGSVETGHLYKAAAAGRADAVGPTGMLGLQRAVGNSAVGALAGRGPADGEEAEERSPVHDVVNSGGGQPLDTDTRADMETRLGADFGDVRVHTDGAADSSAKAVDAHAYTVGNNVVFQRDAYDPGSPGGRTTLAHELTHVIQQRSGPVDGTDSPGGIRVSDPSDRFEREAASNAERALADPAPATPATATTTAAAPAASVQRQEADEDEEPADVQGTFVQRAEAAPEEAEDEEPAT